MLLQPKKFNKNGMIYIKNKILKFNKEELDYIKDLINKTMDHIDGLEKEDMYDFIDSVGWDNIGHLRMFYKYEDVFAKINTKQNINKWAIDMIYDIEGYEVWIECGYTTKEEVYNFIEDDMYCQIYEKVLAFDNQDAEDILNFIKNNGR